MRPLYEVSGARRVLRVGAGEGMVTPAREVTVTCADGRSEVLVPGLHRFDPSHTLVKQRPELFVLCDRRDRTNAPARFRELLASAERNVRRELADPRALEQATRTQRPARTYGRYQLKRRRPTRSKLR